MKNYRTTSHTKYDLKAHLVWITKYRKRILKNEIVISARDMIRKICQDNEVQIIKGHLAPDHVHLFISYPPHLSISKIMQYIKGTTSRKMMMQFPEIRRAFWGKHFWARGYFVVSSGNITDETIIEYIDQQGRQELEKPDSFEVRNY